MLHFRRPIKLAAIISNLRSQSAASNFPGGAKFERGRTIQINIAKGMQPNDENIEPNVTEDAGACLSPTAPRFCKETQRGAKRSLDIPRFNQELQKRKMVQKMTGFVLFRGWAWDYVCLVLRVACV